MANKKLVKAFIQECKDAQDHKAKFKANHIDMDDWFKYSGKIEEDKFVYQFKSQRSNRWVYNENKRCHTLHEIITKKNNNEKDKKDTSEFVEATSADTRR